MVVQEQVIQPDTLLQHRYHRQLLVAAVQLVGVRQRLVGINRLQIAQAVLARVHQVAVRVPALVLMLIRAQRQVLRVHQLRRIVARTGQTSSSVDSSSTQTSHVSDTTHSTLPAAKPTSGSQVVGTKPTSGVAQQSMPNAAPVTAKQTVAAGHPAVAAPVTAPHQLVTTGEVQVSEAGNNQTAGAPQMVKAG